MPKITYIDDEPPVVPIKPASKAAQDRRGGPFIALFLFLSLFMGGLGAVAGIYLMATTNLGKMLGVTKGGNSVNIGSSTTEHLILDESSAVTDTAEKVSPSVVSISTTRNVQDLFGRTIKEKGGGTGFIITSDGLIVTNKHVVSDQNSTYTVFTSDGKNYDAKVLAQDPLNDLAVVKVEASGLPVVELGSSADLKVGQSVIAIGNALGEFNNSVTTGVISAIDRQITASGGGVSENLSGLLQTDAAINPGNSGGPLVNLKGQVVGINTAVAGDAENIGFAIPIDVVARAIDSVKETGTIKRPMIGVRYVPITKDIAQVNHLSVDYGVWVLRGDARSDVAVIPGSPADKAGIKENDIITAVDGKTIDEHNSLLDRLMDYNPGDTVMITVYTGSEKRDVKVTLGTLS